MDERCNVVPPNAENAITLAIRTESRIVGGPEPRPSHDHLEVRLGRGEEPLGPSGHADDEEAMQA